MEWEQERHDLRRELALKQSNLQFLEEELEILKKDMKEKDNKSLHTIKLLKEKNEELSNELVEWKFKGENADQHKETERKQHIILIEQLNDQLARAKIDQDQHDASFFSDIKVLKDQKTALENDLEFLKSEIENMSQDYAKLMQRNVEIIQEKDELSRTLLNKRQELASCIEQRNALQEEVILLKAENVAFKANPQPHASKGNSLFAEVDENRKALKRNLDKLAEKYNELKKVLKSKSFEVSKLRAEKSSLLKKVQEVSTKYENDESQLVNMYKSRIKDLEKALEDLGKQKDTHIFLNSNGEDYKAIDSIFAAKSKEIDVLKQQVDKLSQTILMQGEAIFFLKRDLETKTSQLAFELSEKMNLQEELSEAKALILK